MTPKKKPLTPMQARAKRDDNMDRYIVFLYDLIDSGFSSYANMECVQHGEPDQFYVVFRWRDSDIQHERIEALMGLVKKHGGKLHFRDGKPEVYLGRDK